jgi:hypothetical protein
MMSISVLAIANPVCAQSIPTPSVREFTLTFVPQPSTDATPTYGVDPYTGKSYLLSPGYHVDNSFILITIENQAFTPYTNENGHYISLFYNFSYKAHSEDDWKYNVDNNFYSPLGRPDYRQPESNYTTIKFLPSYYLNTNNSTDEMDFRVQAKIGYYRLDDNQKIFHITFTGQTSDWSNLQTISIPETSTIPTPTISLTPSSISSQSMPTINTVPKLPVELNPSIVYIMLAIVIVIVAVASISLVYFKKYKH